MASSIKLFQIVQKFHEIIGIFPSHSSSNQSKCKIWLLFGAQSEFTIAAFLLFEAESMLDYGFGFFVLVTVLNGMNIYSLFIWQSENTSNFFANCEKFIEMRTHSSIAYRKLTESIESFHKFFSLALCVSVIFCTLTPLPYSFIRYYIFNMDKESFYLFMPSWYPFDWKTPFGYLLAFLAQFVLGVAAGCIHVQCFNLLIGSCWFFYFVAEDITQDLTEFNIHVIRNSNRDHDAMKKYFCDLVQIYSEAKRCVSEFNEIFKYPLFSVFTWTMLSLASILVTIQFKLEDGDSNRLEMASLFCAIVVVISDIFILCESGTKMTNQCAEFHDELGRCDWYALPIALQQMYMILLSDTQNPITMHSYANIISERETAKKIINKAFSYFMILRKFEA